MIKKRVSAELILNQNTVGALKELLKKIPDDARLNFRREKGDRPNQGDYQIITAAWVEEL